MKKESKKHPLFRARAVFIDFENTLILQSENNSAKDENTILDAMAESLTRHRMVGREEAIQLIREASKDFHLPVEAFNEKLGIDLAEVRDYLLARMPEAYHADPDAKPALKHFRKLGLKLWPATTNSGFLCRLKLEAVGLGDGDGGPFFEGLRGGSEIHPLGKSTSAFFRNLLQWANVRADEVVHIGDQREWDRDSPFRAGISQVILLDRSLPEPFAEGENGEIYAQGWNVLRKFIEPL